jgi:hypothetical protein
MFETPENWQELGGETGYNPLSRNILITDLSIKNTVFEYDFYGTFNCFFNNPSTNSLAGYFGIKLGNYDLNIGGAGNINNMLGSVLVPFNQINFKNGQIGYFRYTLTFTIKDVTGAEPLIIFNSAVKYTLADETFYTIIERFITTNSIDYDFSNLTVSTGFTRLSPCFIPVVLSPTKGVMPGQHITFTKLGHTFIRIA